MAWDGANRLWMGTDKGVSIYDGHRISYLNSQHGLEGSYINQLLYDSIRNRMLLITSNKKLYSSDGQRVEDHRLPKGYQISSISISDNFYQLVASVKENNVAYFIVESLRELATAEPVLVVDENTALHIRFGFGEEMITDTTSLLRKSFSGSLKDVRLSKEYNSGKLFASKAYGSVFMNNDIINWNYKAANIKIQVPSSAKWLFGAALTVNEIPAIVFSGLNSSSLLCLKANGETWVVSDSVAGLSTITQLLSGPDNSLLIATLGDGLIICYPSKGKMLLSGKHVRRIAPGTNGDWLVADDQLYFYNHRVPPKATGITIPEATSITELGGILHCTSLLQYQRYTLLNNNKPKLISKIAISAGISDFELLPNNQFELSTYSSGTVLFKDGSKPFDTLDVKSGTLHDDIIENIIHLKDGTAFTSFSNGVLIKKNNGKELLLNKASGLISNTVYYISQSDDNNELWVCTDAGITKVDGTAFTQYKQKDGFVGKKCLYFFKDDEGRKFVVSDVCIMLLTDGKLHPLQSFPIKPDPDALISSVYFNEQSDLLEIGSSRGLFELNITKVMPDRKLLRPLVYYIKTADTVINNVDRNITLSAGSNAIQIISGFEEVDFAGHASLYYNLNGYNDEWLPVPEDFSISIPKLPAGVYDLRMYSVNADGYAGKPETVLQISKLFPWYLARPLRIAYALLAALLVWIGAQVWVRNRIKQRIQHLLIGQQMQQERNRISSELHDNVGSQLTNIIVQLDYVEGSLQQNKADAALQKVVGLQHKARQAMNQLRESIWVLKEDAVKLPAFVGRVHRYALEIFDEDAGINFDMESRVKKEIELTPWQAVNLLRILQECFQNIQKHSGASEVHLLVWYELNMLKAVLKDNGKGFDLNNLAQQGQGINNMRRRATEMGGVLKLQSPEGRGTSVIIEIPITMSTSK